MGELHDSRLSTSGAHTYAIVLAGGRGTRMGGVDKPAQTIGGRRLLDIALDAVRDCTTVVVGPRRDGLPEAIRQTREDPPGDGPVAAVAAGVATLSASSSASFDDATVLLLAADLPDLTRAAVATLHAHVGDDDGGVAVAVDAGGRAQFLLSAWRGRLLRERLDALGTVSGQPMKSLLPDSYSTVRLDVTDCDTPDELDAARAGHRASLPAIDDAVALVREHVRLLTPRRVAAVDAYGGTLAEPLVAQGYLPPQDTSAMDGYAVSGPGPWRLRDDIVRAGDDSGASLVSGDAVRVATGAAVPDGATAVVRDEYVGREAHTLRLLPGAPERDDTRTRGAQWRPGTRLADAGAPIDVALVSLAASAEVTTLAARGPLRVHVALTGDEIVRDGALPPGATRDSLGPVLPRLIESCGAVVVRDEHVRDHAAGFDGLFAPDQQVDAVVVVGATGRGAADELRAALARARADVVVERVRCRPGGSQVVAVLPDGRTVLGLPGNPYAAVAALTTMLPAVVDGATGRAAHSPITAHITGIDAVADAAAVRVLPARSTASGWAVDTSFSTAHLGALVGADALALVPPGATPGTPIELVPLPRF
ncbi:NTP transferase domain-containing protein [Rhodococcus sp. HNM0569]|uniref:NTP transferase domain-containing protein n=1 Tax=Rhodococcus sp. HNM0569 TaxID=2716340 RepID=UPI00146BD946|nr:NTP transferase domain-containing protein [Rhodococcus sp. HNM0569]NLU81964.1 NTP transferase domain-containing protein [Rhodococcus sp. HNM0569]